MGIRLVAGANSCDCTKPKRKLVLLSGIDQALNEQNEKDHCLFFQLREI